MTDRTLTTRSAPTETLDLAAHHEAWTGANAKTRAATAARDHDHSTLWSLTAAFLANGDRVSIHTARSYRAGVLMYLAWATDTGVSILRPDTRTGDHYRTHLTRTYTNANANVSVGTVNTRLATARVLYRAFDWIDLEHRDPFRNVKPLRDARAPEAVRDAYQKDDLARLLEAADDPHDRVALLLGAHAGLRATEMLTLTWDRVTLPAQDANGRWADAGVMLVEGKGKTLGNVPIGDALATALAALPRTESGRVLAHVTTASGLRYRIARLATRAGMIDSARPKAGVGRTVNGKPAPRNAATLGVHRLRHRFGTDVVKSCGLAIGQTALRHASPTTTARYAKDRDEAVAAFVRTLEVSTG